MQKYYVKLSEGHTAKPDQITDGYLGMSGRKIKYTKGVARHKAKIFGGTIEEAKTYIGEELTVGQIPRVMLSEGLLETLKGREVYKHTRDNEPHEVMFYGNVFEEILEERRRNEIRLSAEVVEEIGDIIEECYKYQYIHLIN